MGRFLLLPVFLALVEIFSLCVSTSHGAQKTSENPIRIGATLELKDSQSQNGKLILQGMEDYFRFINDTAGGISGRTLSLVVAGGESAFAEVPQNLKSRFDPDKVDVSAVWNLKMQKGAPASFTKHETPQLVISMCPIVTPSSVKNTFFPFAGIASERDAIFQYILKVHEGLDPPKIGILMAHNSCGTSIYNLNKTRSPNIRVQIITTEQFAPGTADLGPLLLDLKRKGAEYVFMQCSAADAVNALKTADHIHYSVPFFCTWKSFSTGNFNLEKELLRHPLIISFPGCLPEDDTPGIHLIKMLIDRYESTSGFHIGYWQGIAVAAIMARACQRAHELLGRVDGQTVNLALETFQKEDFGGLLPNITYTDIRHMVDADTRIVRVDDHQTFTPLTRFWNPSTEEVPILP